MVKYVCQDCGQLTGNVYRVSPSSTKTVCGDCHGEQTMITRLPGSDPAEVAYLTAIARENKVMPVDMPLHIAAAKAKGLDLLEYLQSLHHNHKRQGV